MGSAMIPLMGRGFQAPDLNESRISRARAQVAQAQARKIQQQIDDENELDSVLSQTGGELTPVLIQNVMAKNPRIGAQLQQAFSRQQADQLKLKEAEQAQSIEKRKRVAGLFGAVQDPRQRTVALMQGIKDGVLTPQEAGELEKQPWEEFVQQRDVLVQSVLDPAAQQSLRFGVTKEQRDAAAAQRAAEEEARKADQFNFEKGLRPSKQQQAEAEAMYAQMKTQGLTPEQKAELARLGISEKQLMAQIEHNRAMEGLTARGQNLTDSRQRELAEIRRDQKPATESEQRAYGFYRRAENAAKDLDAVEDQIRSYGVGSQAFMNYAPNFMQPEQNQQYVAAARQFTEARLRRDSGAAIPVHEFESDRRMYFPMPGDTPKVLEQKRRARQVVLDSLRVQSGRLGQADVVANPPARTPTPGVVEDGYIFLGGDPSNKANWRKAN